MNKVADRMYELCLPRLQRIEHGNAFVGNSHHAAQLMSYYATMASVSDQQWYIMRHLNKVRHATAREISMALGRIVPNSKVASAQLGKLRALHLVDAPSRKGGAWRINSFIANE